MLSRIKSSRTFLYLIFITIAALIFIYYLLSDTASNTLVNDVGKTAKTIVDTVTNSSLIEEVDLDSIKNIITDNTFSDILIT